MVPIMAVIAGLVLLGAVTIIVAVVAVVRKRRRNTGRKGQGLSSLSAPFRSVSASLMGNTSTTSLLLSLPWVCCQFWKLPRVGDFPGLSQLFFSQVEKEGTMLQLQVRVVGRIVPEGCGVKLACLGSSGNT